MNPGALLLEHFETRARRGQSRLRRNAMLIVGGTILGLIIVLCVGAPLFSNYAPDAIDPLRPLAPPFSPGHILGTDQFGRDIWSRILYGGRIDLLIAFGATGVTLVVGTAIGLFSGYAGGWADSVIMRIVDLFFAFPFIVLVIAIVAMLGPSIFNMFVAIWLTSWISYARITRGHVVVAKNREYVLAAKALGYRHSRVMLRHVLPNVFSFVLIFAMVDAASTTTRAQNATCGTRTTDQMDCRVDRSPGVCGRRNANPAAQTRAITATNSKGSRTPPAWYSHPPIEGPTMMPKLVPDMTYPITRPRSSGP